MDRLSRKRLYRLCKSVFVCGGDGGHIQVGIYKGGGEVN